MFNQSLFGDSKPLLQEIDRKMSIMESILLLHSTSGYADTKEVYRKGSSNPFRNVELVADFFGTRAYDGITCKRVKSTTTKPSKNSTIKSLV
jgi:hypothetical protein